MTQVGKDIDGATAGDRSGISVSDQVTGGLLRLKLWEMIMQMVIDLVSFVFICSIIPTHLESGFKLGKTLIQNVQLTSLVKVSTFRVMEEL